MTKRPGFSLIELVIGIAIISFIALATGTLMVTQQKEVRALSEKLLLIETQTQLQHVLLKNEFCDCLFQGQTFNTTPSAEAFNSPLTQVPDGYSSTPAPCTVSTSTLIPAIGQRLASTQMKIQTIGVTNIVHQTGGYYTGTITVGIDPETLIRPLKPITSPIAFLIDPTNGTPTSRPFMSCAGSSLGLSANVLKYGSPVNGNSTEYCPTGFKLTQCHAEINSGDGSSMMYRQTINYIADSAGNLIGCSSGMTDSADTYRLALICVK